MWMSTILCGNFIIAVGILNISRRNRNTYARTIAYCFNLIEITNDVVYSWSSLHSLKYLISTGSEFKFM